MKTLIRVLSVLILCGGAAWASAMGSSARGVIPSDIQQIICVDYRTLKNSPTAMALKAQVLPDNMKQFESALKDVGIDPEKDVDQLTFAAFRDDKKEVHIVGIAQGTFSAKTVLKKIRLAKIHPVKYHDADLYPMSGGLLMSFLDDGSLLFGQTAALHGALDSRDGYAPTLDSNPQVADMIGSVENGTVWSVLDQSGTQNMLFSALGDASKLGDYESVKKRLVGSRYTMSFDSGVNFDLDVVTSDSLTAATLSSLVKAGMLYKKMSATPTEKVAIDSLTVDSDSSKLQMHFKTDDKKFQALLHSDLFAAVSH